jgi:DNA (cytosine-5)-methyltransferase 1
MREIIHPVNEALNYIDELYVDMAASCRGSFLIFRGNSGTGKSTFLHTVGFFRGSVETITVGKEEDLSNALQALPATSEQLRLIVLEGREALTDVSREELEKSIHAINSFVRTEEGERTIVAWPVNTDGLAEQLSRLAQDLGSEALLGTDEPVFNFLGPKKEDFINIANSTISVLNEGASIHDLGISSELLKKLNVESDTIGRFLAKIRAELLRNQDELSKLVSKEKCRIWTIVLAGNDPETDVDGLTRGTLYAADIDRMMSVTNANVVQDLKNIPEKIGILGTYFDARIIHVKMIPALSIVRSFADENLKAKMQNLAMSISKDMDVIKRLNDTPLVHSFNDSPINARSVGTKPGSNTVASFEKLATIASSNDVSLNRCFGEALKEAGVITDYQLEQDIGNGLTRRTDILVHTTSGPIRLEMMWRRKTGRAEIANYVLTKLYNYGRAVKYIN